MANFTAFEKHIISTRHGRVSVAVRNGKGPAIVFLHGNSFSGAIFAKLANDPAFAGLPLIIPDLPGHGSSDNAPVASQTYHYAGFGDCIEKIANTLKLQTYVIFGWSLGGQIAVDMIDRAPGLIGIATYGSAIVQRGPLGLINGFHFSRSMLLAGKATMSIQEAEKFGALCCGGPADSSTINGIIRVDQALRPALSRAALFGKDRDQRTIIAETKTPVCLLLGENDPFIRQDAFAKVSGPSLFGGKTKLIKNCGHSILGAANEKIAPAILHFYQHALGMAEMPIAEPMRMAS